MGALISPSGLRDGLGIISVDGRSLDYFGPKAKTDALSLGQNQRIWDSVPDRTEEKKEISKSIEKELKALSANLDELKIMSEDRDAKRDEYLRPNTPDDVIHDPNETDKASPEMRIFYQGHISGETNPDDGGLRDNLNRHLRVFHDLGYLNRVKEYAKTLFEDASERVDVLKSAIKDYLSNLIKHPSLDKKIKRSILIASIDALKNWGAKSLIQDLALPRPQQAKEGEDSWKIPKYEKSRFAAEIEALIDGGQA